MIDRRKFNDKCGEIDKEVVCCERVWWVVGSYVVNCRSILAIMRVGLILSAFQDWKSDLVSALK